MREAGDNAQIAVAQGFFSAHGRAFPVKDRAVIVCDEPYSEAVGWTDGDGSAA
jgi:hypothetical protein